MNFFDPISLFRERLLIALNFFDVFYDEYEPLLSSDSSKLFLPIIKSQKTFPQRLNFNLKKIELILLESDVKQSKQMKKLLNFIISSKNKTILQFIFDFLCEYNCFKELSWLDSLFFENMDSEFCYKMINETNLQPIIERFYSIETKITYNYTGENNNNEKVMNRYTEEDCKFISKFFEENFLHNFYVSLCYLSMNYIYFILCFNNQILKKLYSGNKDDAELSIYDLISCQEFSAFKDCSKEYLQNKDTVFYDKDVFLKNFKCFFGVLGDLYYLEPKAKLLLFNNNNIGYEKVNILIGLSLYNNFIEEIDEAHLASILKKLEEIINTSFDFMDYNLFKIDENLIFVLFEMLSFNLNFSYKIANIRYFQLLHLAEKNILIRFEASIKDCDNLIRSISYKKNVKIDKIEIKENIVKKLKMYFLILNNINFHEYKEKSIDLISQISDILYNKEFGLPYYKEFKSLFLN